MFKVIPLTRNSPSLQVIPLKVIPHTRNSPSSQVIPLKVIPLHKILARHDVHPGPAKTKGVAPPRINFNHPVQSPFLGLARTVYIHRIYPYIWSNPYKIYRIYTVYIWFWPTLSIFKWAPALCCLCVRSGWRSRQLHLVCRKLYAL